MSENIQYDGAPNPDAQKWANMTGETQTDPHTINITSKAGKIQFMEAALKEARAQCKAEWATLTRGIEAQGERNEQANSAYEQYIQERKLIDAKQKILDELKNEIAAEPEKYEDGIIGALEHRYSDLRVRMLDHSQPKDARVDARKQCDVIWQMQQTLQDEMIERDPNYFGWEQIAETINSEVASVKRDGAAEKLKDAQQDAKTFEQLMYDYAEKNDYVAPRAIKKQSFTQIIDQYIASRDEQLRSMTDGTYVPPDGPLESDKKDITPNQLAEEIAAANRIRAKYFHTPSDDGRQLAA